MLASALHDGLIGARPLDEALAGYERRRDEESMPFFEFNCALAALERPPPETRELLAAVHANQKATDEFLGLIAGTTRVEKFFAPANVELLRAGSAA